MSIAQSVADMIARRGRPLTLRRIVTGGPNVDVAVTGVVRQYQAQELLGPILQGDREVRISNVEIAAASWPGPPRAGGNADRIVIDGKAAVVQNVDPRYDGTDLAMYVIQVRG